MSDSLASERTLEQTPQGGQSERASEAQPQGASGGQTPGGQSAQVEENIKNLQRKLTEKDLESKRALAEAQQARAMAQQLQQRLQQVEDNAAPDDYSRLELRAKRAEETAQQYAQRLAAIEQERQAENARMDALTKIADRYGVPVADIEKANPSDYETAVEAAIEARERRKQRQAQQDDDKRERNTPDIGGGRASTPSTRWEQEYDEARRNKDSVAMMRLLQQRGK